MSSRSQSVVVVVINIGIRFHLAGDENAGGARKCRQREGSEEDEEESAHLIFTCARARVTIINSRDVLSLV